MFTSFSQTWSNREMSWTILQNFVVVPLTIAYLCNQLLAPLPSLTIDELSKPQQEWFKSGQIIDVGPYKMFYKTLDYKGHQESFPTIGKTGLPEHSARFSSVFLCRKVIFELFVVSGSIIRFCDFLLSNCTRLPVELLRLSQSGFGETTRVWKRLALRSDWFWIFGQTGKILYLLHF